MTTLSEASRQWFSRPPDERFTSLTELLDHTRRQRDVSTGRVISNRRLRAVPIEGDHRGLTIEDSGTSLTLMPSHWAFGQFAQRVGAPAAYMRKLPTPIAADCLNWGLRTRDVEELGVLSRRDLGTDAFHSLAAVTGPSYGRIWNEEIVEQLVRRFGDGLSGDWKVPGEFGVDVEVNKHNTTLYASDQDMFVFLADEKNRVEIPNRRKGQPGSLARGFFIGNSEVGAGTLFVAAFFFDYACSNRTVWGAESLQELRIRHTSGAPDRFIEEISPALVTMSQSSTFSLTETVKAAQAKRIEDIDDFLSSRFTSGTAQGIVLAHEADEGRPIETLWDAQVAITAYARGVENQDVRVNLERAAGKVLALAA